MVINLLTLLTGINTVLIIGFMVHYFKKNYVILSMEEFCQVQEALEDYNKMVEEEAKEEEASQERAGGEGGFFRSYIEEPDEDEGEDE